MRCFLFALVIGSSIMAADCAHGGEIVAVVGQFEAIRELPDPCARNDESEELDRLCIALDALYEADYSVREVVSGGLHSGGVITFALADHYGFPDFARYNTALLILGMNEGAPYLEKYLGVAVHPTVDGSWAACGYPKTASDEEGPLEDIQFAPGITFGSVGQLNARAVEEDFPKPVFAVSGSIVHCVKGWSLDRLLEHFAGILEARGEVLEPRIE